MAGIVELISQISDGVIATLAESGYAPLIDGKILLGRVHHAEEGSPPRVLFIPAKSSFGPGEVYGASNYVDGRRYSDETRSQTRLRSIATERITFEVRCWGVGVEPSPEADIDATHTLYRAVMAVVHQCCPGSYKFEAGGWVDAKDGTTQTLQLGREFVFGISIDTPVLDVPAAAAQASGEPHVISAPDDVALNRTNTMITTDGTSGVGCTG
jgi:hypothetical protein